MDADDDLPPLHPVFEDAPADDDALEAASAPMCEVCGTLDQMSPAGSAERPYWLCEQCGAVRLT